MELAKLKKIIKKAQKKYYFGQPIMSDAKYDRLIGLLKKYDPDSPLIHQVGDKVPKTTPLTKVTHKIPMGSQNKINTIEEFRLWAEKVPDAMFLVQEKIDGLSVELVFKNGRLKVASTRGDGFVGEDITHNVLRMRNVKKRIPDFTGALRGEIVLGRTTFEKHLKNMAYVNPRNAAAGIARRKISKGAEHLKVYYFDIISENDQFSTEMDKMLSIKKLGLDIANYAVGKSPFVEKAFEYYVTKYRAALPYDIDGLVVKVNDLALQQKMGEVNQRPKGQVAWKFEAESAETRLVGVRWDMGFTGRLTPVAILAPVELGGTTVRHANLHNWKNIGNLDIGINDYVRVVKRGEIIPNVEEVTKIAGNGRSIEKPEHCPICQAHLQFEGEFLICPNSQCDAKQKGNFHRWAKALELDFLGEAFIEKLFKLYDIKGIWQLYTLTVQQIAALPGFAEKSAKRVYDQIHKKSSLPLATFLTGINIPNISTQTFQLLIDAGFDSIDKLANITEDQLLGVYGIGDSTAQQIVTGLTNRQKTIQKLLKYVTIEEPAAGPLTGQSFCFTGEIEIRRTLAERLVKEKGGVVKDTVTRGLTYLVQADSRLQTVKALKAKEYGTKVISGQEFLKLIDFNILKNYTHE